jgi:hypothetical protein
LAALAVVPPPTNGSSTVPPCGTIFQIKGEQPCRNVLVADFPQPLSTNATVAAMSVATAIPRRGIQALAGHQKVLEARLNQPCRTELAGYAGRGNTRKCKQFTQTHLSCRRATSPLTEVAECVYSKTSGPEVR